MKGLNQINLNVEEEHERWPLQCAFQIHYVMVIFHFFKVTKTVLNGLRSHALCQVS